MNRLTNRWAYRSFNPRMAEAFQRIAFSFGYQWPSCGTTGNEVRFTNVKYFAVDPTTKHLTYGQNDKDVEDHVGQVVTGMESAMELFANPPQNVLVYSEFEIFKDGSIRTNGGRFNADVVDNLISERNKFMGKREPKKKLPWIQFIYTSQNQGRKMRNILVLESGDGLIKGLDMDDDFSSKQYKTEKITGAVSFVGFKDEPS